MPFQSICFEGTKGAGKSSTIEKLSAELERSGYEVEICAPFTAANLFAQEKGFAGAREMISASKQDNQDEIDFIRSTVAQARERAIKKSEQGTKPVVLIYDRGWMTLLPHLYGGRWYADEKNNKQALDKIWQETLDDAPETIFLHASVEVTKQRRSKPDIIGGLDTEDKLRRDVEERRAFAEAHRDKIALSFDTSDCLQDKVVTSIADYIKSRTPKFIALYGGSFNLSTFAHRAVGAAVRDIIQPDEVWFLISPQNPHKDKTHMADFADRVEMAKLNVCGLTKLVVTDIEKEISEKTNSTASSDTLRELIERFPATRFAWVVGADAFIKLHTWHNFEFITEHASLIVLPRAGFTDQVPGCPAAHFANCPELSDPTELKTKNGWYLMRQFPEGNINATDERARVNAGQRPDMRNVHPAVADYVARHGLHF